MVKVNENLEGIRSWDAAASDPDSWHRVTTDEAEYLLEVLPPIYFPAGFACSEPIRFAELGMVYLACAYLGDVPYVRELTRRQMQTAGTDFRSARNAVPA